MIWGCLGGDLIVLELLKMADFGQIQRFFWFRCRLGVFDALNMV